MKHTFFKKMVCPFDKHELNLNIYKQEEEEILEGLITCTHCNRYYPIIHGIPIMSPDEYREKKLELPLLEKWGLTLAEGDDKNVFQLDSTASGRNQLGEVKG